MLKVLLLVAAGLTVTATPQTLLDPAQLKRPVKTGTMLPATCTAGDLFFKTDAPAGSNLYGCGGANTWTPEGATPYSVSSDGVVVGTQAATNFVTGLGLTNTITDTGTRINVQIGLDSAVVQTQFGEQSGTALYCASTSGSGSNYKCFLNPTASVYTTGMVLHWKPDVNGAGGATTLNVDYLGAVPLMLADGATNPGSMDIVAGKLYDLWYDGTRFRVMNGSSTTTLAMVAASGSYNDLIDKPVIPTVPSTAWLLKGSGTGNLVAAIPGTDYAPGTTGAGILKGNGSGGFSAAVSGIDYAPALHGLLSATHSDTVAASPVAGGLVYANSSPAWAQLPGNSSTTKKFLTQTGTGTTSAAPVWMQPAASDITGLAASATTDATNAGNIGSGTLPAGRLPALTGDVLTAGGTTATTVHAVNGAPIPASAPLLGTNSSGQLIAQAGIIANDTTGNAATATQLAATPTQCAAGTYPQGTDAKGNAQNCTQHGLLSATHSDTVAASPVAGGLVYANSSPAWAQLPGNSSTTKKFLTQTGTGTTSAAPVWMQPAASDITGLAASATTDATNAGNIGSGTLPAGRLPALTGDVLTAGGTAATTVHAVNGALIPAGAPLLGTNSSGQLIAQAGTIANDTTGNAATATQLAATPTQCAAGTYPQGIDAKGNAQNCTLATGSVATAYFSQPTDASGSFTLPLANTVYVDAFLVSAPVSISAAYLNYWVKAADTSGCSAGAHCYSVGIYNASGTLLISTSPSGFGTATVQEYNAGTALTLTPGWYLLGFTGSATTATLTTASGIIVRKPWNRAATVTGSTNGVLPSSITVPAASWSNGYVPYVGVRQ